MKLPGFVAALVVVSLCANARSQSTPNFGPNVTIITPGMSPAQVNAALSAVNGYAQFDTNRAAILFMPGSYGTASNPVATQVGYYNEIAGLGTNPNQVTITGGLAVDLLVDGNMTQNFWRSQSNLTEVPVGGQVNGTLDWGVSQGASLRRINVQGNLIYANSGPIGNVNPCAEASGGFTADIAVSGTTSSCSQQQWYTRNSALNGWSDYVWNFVFSGVTGGPAQSYPGGPSGGVNATSLATTPVSREMPFLYVDASGNWNVFSPALQTASKGTTWAGGGLGPGTTLPISSFFIAQPSTSVTAINQALASGQNLILTPGIYQYTQPITVTNPNTVVLGMGYATLIPQAGNSAITVADVDGFQVAGLIIDAGPVTSPVLFEVGTAGVTNVSHAANPTSLNDIVIRIAGAEVGSAGTGLQVDSDNVIIDNLWSWRADHGTGVGWTTNTANHGLVVNGQNVTALGLAVEHYQQEQTLWNGNGGETIFYQSELPYDVPSQSAWMDGSANGFPSYVVAPGVCTHTAFGLGIYSFFNQNVAITDDNAMIVPNNQGIAVTDVGSVFLNGSGQITSVIDGQGATANLANSGNLQPVTSYTGTAACTAPAPITSPVSPVGVTIPAGQYEIQSAVDGLVLNVSGNSTANGAPIIQWPFITGQTNSLWTFVSTSNGYYQIQNVNSGLDLVVLDAFTTSGAPIIQWSFGGTGNDQWKPVQNSDGTYTFYNLHSGLVLDDPASSTANATQYDQSSLTGGTNQKFTLVPYTASVATAPPPTPPATNFNYTIYPGFIGVDLANNTRGAYPDSQVYVQVMGINPATGNFAWVQPNGTITDVSVGDNTAAGHLTVNGTDYPNYAFTLAQAKLLLLPQLLSGRIFISLGSPVYTEIVGSGYAGPNPQNPSDPNVNVHFDWYEFTYNSAGVFINTTQVNQFGLPLTLDVYGNNRTFHQQTGITETVAQIDSEWQAEVLAAFTSTPISNYRILSPAETTFDAGETNGNYFDSYISSTWSYYASNPLNLTIGARSFSGTTSGNTFTFNEVNTNNGAFQGGTGYAIGYPTTQNVLECNGAFASGNPNNSDLNSVDLQIEAQLCAAFNRSVATNVAAWTTPAAFYQTSPANFYAAFWHRHSINGLAYGFAYDDVSSQSSTITTSDPEHMAFGIGW